MKLTVLGDNETEIFDQINGLSVLFSYDTPVAAQLPSGRYVKTEEYHSRTTSRHINKWLNGSEAQREPQSFFDTIMARGVLL